MRSNFAIVAMMTVFALATAGCELKKEREEREAREAEVRKEHLLQAQTAASFERAKQKLRTRTAIYQALAGNFEGGYVGRGDTLIRTQVRIRVSNLPATAEVDQMVREDEANQKIEAIALDIKTLETLDGGHTRPTTCVGLNIKPDFSAGTFQFDCAGQGTVSIRRVYVFSLASGDLKAMVNDTPETKRAISTELGNDVVSGRVSKVGGFHLSVQVNPAEFFGSLARKAGN